MTTAASIAGGFCTAAAAFLVRHAPWVVLAAGILGSPTPLSGSDPSIDLTHAIVVIPDGLPAAAHRAANVLGEEVAGRTWVSWEVSSDWPEADVPAIVVGTADVLRAYAGRRSSRARALAAGPAEGYRIWIEAEGTAPRLFVAGNDPRGVLFGVGHLLRSLRLERDRVYLATPLDLRTAPRTPLRGHQLGYRPKANSYDGFDLKMWDRYIRELALFGTNAIELIPPRSDDAPDSPNFPRPPLETMIGMSRIAADYDLDVWVWYPALDGDYRDPAQVEFALEEWAGVLSRLPRLDAIFVPSGDPGNAPADALMALLQKQLTSLRRFHPGLQLWVSVQGWYGERLETFLSFLRTEPDWLAGIVYGPQSRITLAELRRAAPARYPIRHYPDITHTWHAQYPMPDWDRAFALTLQREPINPRPQDQAAIFRHTAQDAAHGFITYSEGVNDDVNKVIWSALGWDPDADLREVLREYARLFVGLAVEDAFAEGLFALEQNWRGPALENPAIDSTLALFQRMERESTPQVRANWRFQMAMYRAYYDAFIRARLAHETELQHRAIEALRLAPGIGAAEAMEEAESILAEATTRPVALDLRARVFEYAEALFQSTRMQLSTGRHFASSSDRGANLDSVDYPLNDRGWLLARFAEIRELPQEADRLRRLARIVDWRNPGPDGFYDDIGDPRNRLRVVEGPGFENDPGFFRSLAPFVYLDSSFRLAWQVQAMTLYLHPLTMRYTGLDPSVDYRLRVVYGRFGNWDSVARLEANGIEIHTYHDRAFEPLEFDIPRSLTAGGELILQWHRDPQHGGIGPGKQVAEVWLMRKDGG